MKVLHLNHSDINGGAARAAYRIHHALRAAGVDSSMSVNVAASGDWTVQAPLPKWSHLLAPLRPQLISFLVNTLRTQNRILHSPAILPSKRLKEINACDADLVHLHWIAGEMLSIADIGRIKKPLLWTLHDMWAFCGAEHYAFDDRWRQGYRRDNRPAHESGFDLNRWTWRRKLKHWRRPLHIATPSRWLADCVRQSALMRDWPVSVAPNCIDTERWRPMEQSTARQLFGLPQAAPLLLFSAAGGVAAHHKGFDLLVAALARLGQEIPQLQLVISGQHPARQPPDLGLPIHYVGSLHDDLSLCALYNAVDVVATPSRLDNFPNVAVEAHACGAPVVAFAVCGLLDIVEHQGSGYLAKPFDVDDLAAGIKWTLNLPATGGGETTRQSLRLTARNRALQLFANDVVAARYKALYEQVLQDQ